MLRKDAKVFGGSGTSGQRERLLEQPAARGKANLRFISLYIFYLLSIRKSSAECTAPGSGSKSRPE
jgi:hypothetical protein